MRGIVGPVSNSPGDWKPVSDYSNFSIFSNAAVMAG